MINQLITKCNDFRDPLRDDLVAKLDYFNQRDNKDYISELDNKYQKCDDLLTDLDETEDLPDYQQKIKELTTKLYQLANQEAERKGERVETIPPHLMSDDYIISLLDLLDDLKQEKKQSETNLNQDKSQMLADLKELKGEITDKKITKKITNSWQLAEYVGKVAKIIQAEVIAKEQKATRTAKKELADLENKINDLLGTQTDANPNGIPDGKTLKQLIDDYNSGQIKITAYEKIIKNDLGFDPASPDLNTQIKKQLGGVKLAEISTDLKKLVDRYNISNDLQGKLSQIEKEALAAQKELEKYQDFVRSLIENIIGVVDNHSEKNDLSVLEKDIRLGLNDITKGKVLKVIKELINKPNPDTEIVENLREKIHVQELIITDYQSGDKYMSKEMISNKMQETLKILKIPTSQYYQLASAQSLPEMGTSFEKLLREEVNQKEKARNKLIKINVILAVLTIGSLLTLT
ncbi:15753_t:CDS:2 [Cetraspora pellucida]|uniref:15753_t:CDS:1 n=1 Tax=Cetraspora pellucida TaxID=1433469 RepID=A0ACA9LJQ5_9GLOM|nr:15753_t:CDS:2 [Cetraspora pellucida]